MISGNMDHFDGAAIGSINHTICKIIWRLTFAHFAFAIFLHYLTQIVIGVLLEEIRAMLPACSAADAPFTVYYHFCHSFHHLLTD